MSQTKKRKKAEPDLLGKGQSKTELPLLAKVELGLIQGDKAIEVLCKEIRVSEAEYKRVKGENNALETRNIGLEDDLETLEGENAKLREELVRQNAKLAKMALRFDKAECIIADLRERLEAVRKWYQRTKDCFGSECTLSTENLVPCRDVDCKHFFSLKELGVLLSPKEVDSNQNLSSHQCWLTHSPLGCSWVDCQDCPMRELEYYGGLERKFKELDQKTREGNEKFRCDEFGNPNRSDTCDQCPSNTECFEEEKKLRKTETK